MHGQPNSLRSAPAVGEWRVAERPVEYPEALAAMEQRVEAILSGTEGELVWLLDHPPMYTAGTSARAEDLLWPDRFPVYETRRGGEFTYHGPGQRVAYAMLDLNRRGRDVRAYVHSLEEWVIRALAAFGVRGERRAGRVGVWVVRGGAEDKIAAIGVRVRRWVTFHGVAINVEPDLSHFNGIVPCGIRGHESHELRGPGAAGDDGGPRRRAAEVLRGGLRLTPKARSADAQPVHNPCTTHARRAGSTGRRDIGILDCDEALVRRLGGRFPAEGFARASVEGRGDGVEVVRPIESEVGALREVLPEQAIGVLVGASLPRAARIAEADGQIGENRQFGMPCHLRSLVPGQRPAELPRQGDDASRDGVAHGLGAVAAVAGPFLTRGRVPCPGIGGRWSSIVNRVVRSTRVPMADCRRPRIRSPSQWPGTARSVASAGRSPIMIPAVKERPRPASRSA